MGDGIMHRILIFMEMCMGTLAPRKSVNAMIHSACHVYSASAVCEWNLVESLLHRTDLYNISNINTNLEILFHYVGHKQ